jgi:uncharacterized protein YeaO (DUF488 family)
MLKVYTSQVGRYHKLDGLDITAQSGEQAFAPSWDLVWDWKKRKISQEEYLERYTALMRKSYIDNRYIWDDILSMDRIVLLCCCPKNSFCHKYILVNIFVKLGAEYMGEI